MESEPLWGISTFWKELARNVHAAVKALCMEERTVQPKRRNAESVLWRDTTQLCAIQRKLSEDWKKKRMSYWVSSQRSIPERERNQGEQPQSILWNSKTSGTQKSWSTAKRLTLEWTPEPMSQSPQEDTSLRTLRWSIKQTRSFSVQGRQKSTSSVSSKRHWQQNTPKRSRLCSL